MVKQLRAVQSFELVRGAQAVAIYIEDHGKPFSPVGMSGRLTILHEAKRSEATLEVVGDKLEARGVTLAKSSKVVAHLKTA